MSGRFSLVVDNERVSGLTRDGTTESVSRNKISGANRDTGKIRFLAPVQHISPAQSTCEVKTYIVRKVVAAYDLT